MRVPERFWWGWLVAAGMMLAAAVYFGAESVTGKLTLVTSLQLPDAQAAAVSLWWYVGLPSVMCVVWLVRALRARGRYVRRRAAVAGDASAMPLARRPSVESALPTVATSPDLSVRSERRGPLVEAMRVAVVALSVYFFAIFAAGTLALMEVTLTWVRGPFVSEERVLAAVAVMTWLLLGVSNPMRQQVRQLALLAANAEGVEYRRELGRRIIVPWSEMRLVEVTSSAWGGFPRTYRLYSPRHVIEWSMSPAATNGHRDAFDQRQADIMAALVRAQTGLAPRTFSKALRADRGDWPPNPARGLAPSQLIFGLVTLALAVAVLRCL